MEARAGQGLGEGVAASQPYNPPHSEHKQGPAGARSGRSFLRREYLLLPTCPQGSGFLYLQSPSPASGICGGWNGMCKSLLRPHFGPRRKAAAPSTQRSVELEAGHEASWALTCRKGAPRFPRPHGTRQRAPLGAEELGLLSLSFPSSPHCLDKCIQGPSWPHLRPGQSEVSSFPRILLQQSLHPGLCLTRMARERRGTAHPNPAEPRCPCCPCLPGVGWPWPRNALWFLVKQCHCGGAGGALHSSQFHETAMGTGLQESLPP